MTLPEPDRQPLHRHFEWWAENAGDRVAVTEVGATEVSKTYGALNRDANRLAHHIVKLGVEPGQLVGVAAARGVGLLTALLAVLKAGCGYVPLDPSYPRSRLELVADDCALRLVVGRSADSGMVGGSGVRFVGIDTSAVFAEPDGNQSWSASLHDPMYVIHTSGSTGRPKGVVVPHICVPRLFSASRKRVRFGRNDVWMGLHSFSFDFSVWEMWGALAHGGCYVVVSQDTARDPEELWSLIVRHGITVLCQTPTAFRWLAPVALDAGRLPDSLRLVMLGGEQLTPAMLSPWLAAYGDHKPQLINMYGPTETTVHATLRRILTSDAGRTDSPIGQPLDDVRIRLLDPEGTPVRLGEVGEMYISGAGVTGGYLNRRELTADCFLPVPESPPGSLMYRTGDLARLTPSGDLIFQGRADRQVQVRGYRVEPGEVEALIEGVSGVEHCAVVPRLDEDGGLELIAYVMVDDVSPLEIRRTLSAVAPPHLIPAGIVSVDALPLTPQGKLDVEALVPSPRPVPLLPDRDDT